MSDVWESVKRFFEICWEHFSAFLSQIFLLVAEERPGIESDSSLRDSHGDSIKSILLSEDELHDHDELHVRFTRSIAETPSAFPPKPTLERRPTSGKGLLAVPMEELLEDSDENEITFQRLASSSDFAVMPIGFTAKKTTSNVSYLDDYVTAPNSVDTNLQRKLENALGQHGTELSENSMRFLSEFISKLPDVTEQDLKKVYNEMCKEYPSFARLSPTEVFKMLQEDASEIKMMSTEDACETIWQKFCSC